MRKVSIVGIGQVPVRKHYDDNLRSLGARVVRAAMKDARIRKVDALFCGNMLGDELQGQKHLGALIADEAGLRGIEVLDVSAATATGAAALRMAYLLVASGEADRAVAVGVEKMGTGVVTPALAQALDAEHEVPVGATMISKNAELMRSYLQRYDVPKDAMIPFSVNAHRNARYNLNALFYGRSVSARDVRKSRQIHDPLRLLDCSPICEGAAAVVVVPANVARAYCRQPVNILASSVVTDRFRIDERPDPLMFEAARNSARIAFRRANINLEDVSFFELHDAFSITACLLLEAVGFAPLGQGWRLGAEKEIRLRGKIPISTMGGLKARGHPIGATALYQACEIVQQLTGGSGKNQVRKAKVAMLQSVGGVATTMVTHVFGTM